MDWRHLEDVSAATVGIYNQPLNICVWNKSNAGMGSLYRSKHEMVFVYRVPGENGDQKGKRSEAQTQVVMIRERDSDNAFAAMCLLGIATEREGGRPLERSDSPLDPPDFGWVKLTPWTIQAACERMPSLREDADLMHSLRMQGLHPDQVYKR
jgi:hypothetical protein